MGHEPGDVVLIWAHYDVNLLDRMIAAIALLIRWLTVLAAAASEPRIQPWGSSKEGMSGVKSIKEDRHEKAFCYFFYWGYPLDSTGHYMLWFLGFGPLACLTRAEYCIGSIATACWISR